MNCVFCKIITGELPSHKVWENDEFMAILDIFPNRDGVTLVIPKKHKSSNFIDLEDAFLGRFISSAKDVSLKITKGLGVERVVLVIEGMGVSHAHIKLYPVYDEKEGSVSTETGPRMDDKELEKIANKIR